MRRVFEFGFDKKDNEPGIINLVEASQVFAKLEYNFGRIGAEYARILATEHKDIEVAVTRTLDEFRTEVNGTQDEDYWWGMCGVLLAGATLARRLGAEMDVPAMRKFLIEAFHHNRKIRGTEGTEGGSLANTEQALAAFLNFYVGSGNVICTDKVFEHKNFQVETIQWPEKSHPIFVQIVRDQCLIIISKHKLREFLEKNDIQGRQVFDGLKKYFNAVERKRTLGGGTSYAQVQERCIEIPVRNDQILLYGLLTAHGEPQR